MYVVKQSLIFVHILCISLFKRFSCWLPSFAVSWFSTFMVNNRLELNNFDQFHVHYSWRILCTRCSVPDSNHSGLSLRYITLLIKTMHPYIIFKLYICYKTNRVGTSSSSHWKVICSRRDIDWTLLDWLIDWLMFNVQRAIFQLYSGREKNLNATGLETRKGDG